MDLYDLVRQCNGIVGWKFSQSNIKAVRLGGVGICAALSASWINYHAHDDSLANHFRSGGIGLPDILPIHNMMFLQESFNSHRTQLSKAQTQQLTNAQDHQLAAVQKWFKMHGMILLTIARGHSAHQNIEYSIISSLAKSYACYAYVVFGNVFDSHSVATWLGGSNYINGDICFFEPNYGEFWFESKQDFFRFFPAAFYKLRNSERKFNESWIVMTYALSNRAL